MSNHPKKPAEYSIGVDPALSLRTILYKDGVAVSGHKGRGREPDKYEDIPAPATREGAGGVSDAMVEAALNARVPRIGGVVRDHLGTSKPGKCRSVVIMEVALEAALAASRCPGGEGGEKVDATQAMIEAGGQAIYEHWHFGSWLPGDKPAWVPRGNSETQEVARAFARKAIEAALSPASTATGWQVPDGWKLVPEEPTPEMLKAVGDMDNRMFAGGNQHGADFETLWAVAMDAAPPPPTGPQQGSAA